MKQTSTKEKIIENLAKDKTIRTIINNVSKDTTDPDLADLEQDIYYTLLEKDEDWLEGIYERGQINYYVTRLVMNNINSKTSRWYYIYKKNKLKQIRLDDYKETTD